jgi:hypothetical protein
LKCYFYRIKASLNEYFSANYRDDRRKKDGRWVLITSDFYEEAVPNAALKVLDSLVNVKNILVNGENIRCHITKLQKRVKKQQREEGDPKKFLKNYVFKGAPGTGKTTVARVFGEIFHNLGLLSSNVVVECKAMELIGEYVGHSAARMRYPLSYLYIHYTLINVLILSIIYIIS